MVLGVLDRKGRKLFFFFRLVCVSVIGYLYELVFEKGRGSRERLECFRSGWSWYLIWGGIRYLFSV